MADEEVDWGMDDYNDESVREEQGVAAKSDGESVALLRLSGRLVAVRCGRGILADGSSGIASSREELQSDPYGTEGKHGRRRVRSQIRRVGGPKAK